MTDQPDPSDQALEMDDFTARLIGTARLHLAQEPARPDPEVHTDTYLEYVTRAWDDWNRTAQAYRLLIGTALAATALGE